ETFISYHEELAAAALQRQALGRQGVHPERFIQTGSAETILALVEAGLGYSLVPSLDPEGPRWPGVTAHELKSPRMEFPVFLAWRRDMPEHPAFDDLLATAPST
ncbi:MAG: LysR family transcriptional regulator substrate-binding protein, partial [Planctomycetes bacterium]|nr:LysR family transcriptional regulator substrate-binding protein [Planctomycetota bacterium]